MNNDFDFAFETDNYDDDITHVWNCDERNVFRRVVGVKLFKTKEVLKNDNGYIRDAYFLTFLKKKYTFSLKISDF